MVKSIKQKLNERKRLLKSNRTNTTSDKTKRIKSLKYEIKAHFHNAKSKCIRRSITPENTAYLWKAVKTAKVKHATMGIIVTNSM